MYLQIDEGFDSHIKTLALCRLMKNPEAGIFMLRLWTWACRSAPDGDLSGMEAFDIESAVKYRPLDGACYAAMVKAGFIDELPDGSKEIHNWHKRTGGDIEAMTAEAMRKKVYRKHRSRTCGGLEAFCRHCIDEKAAGRPKDVHGLSAGHTADKPTQTSQDQTSPVQARPEIQSTPRAHALEPESAAKIQPDSPSNLIHVLGVMVREEHPEVGLWTPGRFADRDAVNFFADIPNTDRATAAATILARLIAYVAAPSDDGWTLKGFLDRFNELGQPGRPPRSSRGSPRDVRVGHVRAETETKHPVGYQKI